MFHGQGNEDLGFRALGLGVRVLSFRVRVRV
jgi:hypothetical protein